MDTEKVIDDLRPELTTYQMNQNQLIATIDDLTERVYELEKRVVTLADVASSRSQPDVH